MFEIKSDREVHRLLASKKENKRLKCYDYGKNLCGQPIKNDQITYDNIQKITTGQGDDYTDCCLLDYLYFKEHYKLIAIGLSKQQNLDGDPKAKQQINFTESL